MPANQAGAWQKLGPWTATVSDGKLTLQLRGNSHRNLGVFTTRGVDLARLLRWIGAENRARREPSWRGRVRVPSASTGAVCD